MNMVKGHQYNLIARHPEESNKLNKILAAHQMRRVHAQEIPLVRSLAADLFDFEPAPVEVLAKVERWSHLSLLVRVIDREITGFLAVIPLTREGHRALRSGKLTGANIQKSWVASQGAPLEAGLLWGMGGKTVRDQTSIVSSLLSLWNNLYPGMPTYSRAATRHGLRLMKRMGYELVLSLPNQPDLWGKGAFPEQTMSKAEYQASKKKVA
ncbi:MAG: hypothetical protein COA85_13480 [Robiginitomaculum sp.]|nr:MAG: hypothetical protein COA85_13480 [Robiginitomaculum sp.]